MKKVKILVTGGTGFAGAHIIEDLYKNTDWQIVILDRLTYAGSLQRLAAYHNDPRVSFVFHDFRGPFPASVLKLLEGTTYIIHNGAETHVERSLVDPEVFVTSNVLGTMHVLNAARQLDVERFLYVSTDEVHGPAPDGVDFEEDAPIKPSNPYSASKAAAEALTYSYWKSFRLPIVISRTMNLFGERQHPEKFVPMTIRKVLHGQQVTVHGNVQQIGSRKWLHARNQADALRFLLTNTGVDLGETYHIAGEEYTNLDIAALIAHILGKVLDYQLVDFHAVRNGHDRRYSLCGDKLLGLGWTMPYGFLESLTHTVEWSARPENGIWLATHEERILV